MTSTAIILLVLQARWLVKRARLVLGSFLCSQLFLLLDLLSQLFFLLWTYEWSSLRPSRRWKLYWWSPLTDHFLRSWLSLSWWEEERFDLVRLSTDLSRPQEKLLQLRLLVCWVLTLRSWRVSSLALLKGAICQPCVKDTLHSVFTVLIHLQQWHYFELVLYSGEFFDEELHLVFDSDAFPDAHETQNPLIGEGISVEDADQLDCAFYLGLSLCVIGPLAELFPLDFYWLLCLTILSRWMFFLSVLSVQIGSPVKFFLQALNTKQIDLVELIGMRLWRLKLFYFLADLLKALVHLVEKIICLVLAWLFLETHKELLAVSSFDIAKQMYESGSSHRFVFKPLQFAQCSTFFLLRANRFNFWHSFYQPLLSVFLFLRFFNLTFLLVFDWFNRIWLDDRVVGRFGLRWRLILLFFWITTLDW